MASDFRIEDIITLRAMERVGQEALFIIKERVFRGEFLPGSSGSSEYSTTPAPLPAGALTKAGVKNFNRLVKSGEAHWFVSKGGRKWIVLTKGYKQLRELVGKPSDKVTLSWSGRMMRNLKVLRAGHKPPSVTLGFSDTALEQIASYHDVEGAGKRKVTHKFLGLTESELNRLSVKVREVLV